LESDDWTSIEPGSVYDIKVVNLPQEYTLNDQGIDIQLYIPGEFPH